MILVEVGNTVCLEIGIFKLDVTFDRRIKDGFDCRHRVGYVALYCARGGGAFLHHHYPVTYGLDGEAIGKSGGRDHKPKLGGSIGGFAKFNSISAVNCDAGCCFC